MAAWRAQASHLAGYVLLPFLWAMTHAAFSLLLLPFLLLGAGDRDIDLTDGSLAHLQSPACWVALAPCEGPTSHWLNARYAEARRCASTGVHMTCPASSPFFSALSAFSWRQVWFAGWLSWFLLALVLRERSRGNPSATP